LVSGQVQPNRAEFLSLPDFHAVTEKKQAGAFAVLLSGLVPYNGEKAAVIRNAFETEIIPCVPGYQRINQKFASPGLRPYANQAGDNQITETGMIIML
jgi:hypothetical protein